MGSRFEAAAPHPGDSTPHVSQSILSTILQFARRHRARLEFRWTRKTPCDASALNWEVAEPDIARILLSDELAEEWPRVETTLRSLDVTDYADSVNPGDRRTIYYLVRQFKPRTVLEIGTHLGASTIHIAAALRKIQEEDADGPRHITTVDIHDVNDESTAWWRRYGACCSPLETALRLGLADQISFVTGRSLEHFASCDERYDFIFLDGDHSARTVYREVPAALTVLRNGGVILLHDFFPAAQPLWPGRAAIEGPWLAVERLRTEGAGLRAIPLREVPWPTKSGSQTTSLALLVGSER
jgi:predicted O-methyltransferase YrrM